MAPTHPVFTIGHSTREADAFVGMLRAHGVQRLVDVRRFPGSRRYPWFNRENLEETLRGAGIDYTQVPEFGGRRGGSDAEPEGGSPNTAWRNASFRAYADHAGSDAFQAALQVLIDAAGRERVALMCAEAVPWRCHRQLIADALVARGVEVLHIMGEDRADPHTLRSEARVLEDGRVIYPGPEGPQGELFD